MLESLQIEELNNYLRAACINSQAVSVDEISGNQQVAVLYPIVMPEKIGIIANLPTPPTKADKPSEGELKYYSSEFDFQELERDVEKLRRQMVFVDYDVLETAADLYTLLVPEGLSQDLADSMTDTLVFIPDGVLRSIPIGGDREDPLELLVLSACETAAGDKRAALGLAGMAIRAGARSTLASLWQVDDLATSIFMTKFYEELSASRE